MVNNIRSVQVIRYITPLREGGSMPAIIEADDEFKYVLKFRGAGQGVRALIAELIGGEIARALGLRIPELVFADLDDSFGRTEPDEEIQDLLKFSIGQNLGLHYLSGAISFDPLVHSVDAELASKIVWLDAYLMNMDRTPRNTNMLFWNKELWLIDHGAALYFHHNWETWESQANKPFQLIKDHVLVRYATQLREVDSVFKEILTPTLIAEILALIPEDWLNDNYFSSSSEQRAAYSRFLEQRLINSEVFIKEAENAN
ncbi:MAG: aminotransferase class I and II [Pedobacter sp.]|nr:MAG: aminotransferase class I and II [Pedobacter sp.]